MKLSAIRAANAAFAAKQVKGAVAVFVGATSGIGEAAMKKFTEITIEPRIYFVGRNAQAAARITTELHALNPGAKIEFIQSPDLSLLRNSLSVAESIKVKETKLNLLVLSQGYMSFDGHSPTADGIERKLAVNYYSRFLILRTLLPLLSRAAHDDPELGARTISVYAPGTEGKVVETDFELARRENFSLAQTAAQGTAMNSLAMEHLAETYPDIGFMHVMPGVVMTGLARDAAVWFKPITAMFAVVANKREDVGEGLAWLATDRRWKTGLGLVDWRGEDKDSRRKSPGLVDRAFGGGAKWWREGLGKIVWEQGAAVEERVLGRKI